MLLLERKKSVEISNNWNEDWKNYKKYLPIAVGASTVLVATESVLAQDASDPDPVTDITNMVTALGTITGTVIGVIVAALTVRLAVKQVNRLMTKG